MITIRKSDDRGHFDFGWLDTRHTFSFGEYHDPKFMGFRHLRVINEDFVAPGKGFPTHDHHDMEIISYVIEGALEHKDSLGHGAVLRPGEVQRMTAGKGIAHSEFNPSKTDATHLLQIWLFPEKRGLAPSWEQKEFPTAERKNKLRLVASPDAADGSVTIHQNVRLYAGLIEPKQSVTQSLAKDRYAWIQVVRGEIDVNGQTLKAGDAAAVSDETKLAITSKSATDAEILFFDLA